MSVEDQVLISTFISIACIVDKIWKPKGITFGIKTLAVTQPILIKLLCLITANKKYQIKAQIMSKTNRKQICRLVNNGS